MRFCKKNLLVKSLFLVILAINLLCGNIIVLAEDSDQLESQVSTESSSVDQELEGKLKYYLGRPLNAGKDTGYSKLKDIELDDPHFGWVLGKFFVTGYTQVMKDKNENPVFLKTVGDTVNLLFRMDQDINRLNDEASLSIAEDTNGYDKFFGVEKTNFGYGTVLIRHTDYQNNVSDATTYTNFLKANTQKDANTTVDLFEEGDYEVSLNYEIKNNPRVVFGLSVVPTYTNYKINFKFSVRNGNSMVYPFDVETKAELNNTALTENGFYLDLAKSRYLDINIKKEVMKEGASGLTEDVRYNRPARDGDEFTEEGIYTITATNKYTNEKTTKTIYVGTDDVLKVHVLTGLSIEMIEEQIAQGGQIMEDGTIELPELIDTSEFETSVESEIIKVEQEKINETEKVILLEEEKEDSEGSILIGLMSFILVVIGAAFVWFKRT